MSLEAENTSIEPEFSHVVWNVNWSKSPEAIANHLLNVVPHAPMGASLIEAPLDRDGNLPPALAQVLEDSFGYDNLKAITEIEFFEDGRFRKRAACCGLVNSFSVNVLGHRPVVLSDKNLFTESRQGIRIMQCLLSEVEVPTWDKPVSILNVHLPWLQFCSPTHRREIRNNLLGLIESIEGSLIVVGDFNAIPSSRTMREMRSRLEMQNSPDNPTWRMLGMAAVIDYVFTTPDIASKVEVLKRGPSDHSPLYTTFTKH